RLRKLSGADRRSRSAGRSERCPTQWDLDEGRRVTEITPFAPAFMTIGVLTAAQQELTPREVRDADPDRAIEDWLDFAADLGADYIQLSAAFHPSQADVPPEATLDPVANTLDLRQPFDAARARRVQAP